jgi:hypothetical protein
VTLCCRESAACVVGRWDIILGIELSTGAAAVVRGRGLQGAGTFLLLQ